MCEWEHIFKGEAVDLDKILSSLHCITIDPERKACLGDTEISIGGVETKRKVESSSEWSTAWKSASRATSFVFEHRERELAEYGDYIEQLFAAKQPRSHNQIILFDKGVRNEVGGGQTLLLTDYQYFTSLYVATLQDDGVDINDLNASEEEVNQTQPRATCVIGSTVKAVADLPIQPASIGTPVRVADRLATENHPVEKGIDGEVFGMRPRYLRHNLWMPDADPLLTAAEWTLLADPLPPPSQQEFKNLAARQTINEHPELFAIVSPINVEALETLTSSHPNKDFVESVLEGLREGFWPWASAVKEGYPLTWDESKQMMLTPEKEEFLNKQLEHEVNFDRMSQDFGMELLPGMYCMPNYVVPKPHTDDWRLVNDLSAGLFSLNSMVDRQRITGFPLDNLAQLGELLMKNHRLNPGKRFVIWKSDVVEAYRICPMHVLWQLKQAIRIRGKLRIE